VRLFLAIDPGEECRRRVAGTVDSVRATTSGIRWVRENQFHLTMAFLGTVDESRVAEISAATEPIVRRYSPFSVKITGVGVFPDWRKIRVVWLGLRDAGALVQLGGDVGETCATLGFPQRPFRAHLTIGRITGPLSAEQKVSLSKALAVHKHETYPFDVSRVLLMRSVLSPAGSEYSVLASFPLGGS
jgi:RNA 2',3'-cyclic 3'-phosphodiesterase